MRNLAQYPLTDGEIIQFCEDELAKFMDPDDPVGGMQAMIYQAIIQRVRENPRDPKDILDQGAFLRSDHVFISPQPVKS